MSFDERVWLIVIIGSVLIGAALLAPPASAQKPGDPTSTPYPTATATSNAPTVTPSPVPTATPTLTPTPTATPPAQQGLGPVLLTMGMSLMAQASCGDVGGNCTTPGQSFIVQAANDPQVNHNIAIVTGAIGGRFVQEWMSPESLDYDAVAIRLSAAGRTPVDVRYIYLWQDDFGGAWEAPLFTPNPTTRDPAHLATKLRQAIRAMKGRYPNLQQVILTGSTPYVGCSQPYNAPPFFLTGEPWAGLTWQSVDQVVAQQGIAGVTITRAQGSAGETWYTPSWWRCDWYGPDGLHFNAQGIQNAASGMLYVLKTNPATCWFRVGGCS